MANRTTKMVRATLKSRAGQAAIGAVAVVAEKAARATARASVTRARNAMTRAAAARGARAKAKAASGSAAASRTATARAQTRRSIDIDETRWGKRLLAAGVTRIPNAILAQQVELGLHAKDMALLLQLWRRWDTHDALPHATLDALAADTGLKRATVQKHLRHLEKVGLIERVATVSAGKTKDRSYSFRGLIAKAGGNVAAGAKAAPRAVQKPAKRRVTKRKTGKAASGSRSS